MQEQFIPYKQALELKELGFDEECLGTYYLMENDQIEFEPNTDTFDSDIDIPAPLWQQAFDWLLKKLNNYSYTQEYENYSLQYYDGKEWNYLVMGEKLNCLKKLIEIIKAK